MTDSKKASKASAAAAAKDAAADTPAADHSGDKSDPSDEEKALLARLAEVRKGQSAPKPASEEKAADRAASPSRREAAVKDTPKKRGRAAESDDKSRSPARTVTPAKAHPVPEVAPPRDNGKPAPALRRDPPKTIYGGRVLKVLDLVKQAAWTLTHTVTRDVDQAVKGTNNNFTSIITRVEHHSSTLAAILNHTALAATELAKAQTAGAAAVQGHAELQRELQALRKVQWEVCGLNTRLDKGATNFNEAILDLTNTVEKYMAEK